MAEFEFDIKDLQRGLLKASEEVRDATREVMADITDEWVMEARDIAPMSGDSTGGRLRRQIQAEKPLVTKTEVEAVVSSNANNADGFNYAYYIHEVMAKKQKNKFKNPSTEGTVPNYLDAVSGDKDFQRRARSDIYKAIRKACKKAGWL